MDRSKYLIIVHGLGEGICCPLSVALQRLRCGGADALPNKSDDVCVQSCRADQQGYVKRLLNQQLSTEEQSEVMQASFEMRIIQSS